jgi:hypothetical protein
LRASRPKCRFDPVTGCVIWIGGKSNGGGRSGGHYGVFWDSDEKRRWFAHRWAAMHIHGFDLSGGLTVGHCCPHTHDGHPNPLCVEHLEMQTLADNVAERNTRVAKAIRAAQSALQRQYWLFVDRGYEPAPEITAARDDHPDDIPYFAPPEWLVPFLPKRVDQHGEAPF